MRLLFSFYFLIIHFSLRALSEKTILVDYFHDKGCESYFGRSEEFALDKCLIFETSKNFTVDPQKTSEVQEETCFSGNCEGDCKYETFSFGHCYPGEVDGFSAFKKYTMNYFYYIPFKISYVDFFYDENTCMRIIKKNFYSLGYNYSCPENNNRCEYYEDGINKKTECSPIPTLLFILMPSILLPIFGIVFLIFFFILFVLMFKYCCLVQDYNNMHHIQSDDCNEDSDDVLLFE